MWGCDPFRVSLLTDRHMKDYAKTNFVHISQQWTFFMCDVWHQMSNAEIRSAHSVLRLQISTFWTW